MRLPLSVFISYAHKDESLRQKLETHLSLLQRQGLVASWHDRQILPGASLAEEIDAHLEAASLILLLISPDFLASDYCYDVEMKRALERHASGEACVIPIILRPSDWHDAPFGDVRCLPRDGKAVTTWRNRDEALVDIAQGLRRTIEELTGHAPDVAQPSSSAVPVPTTSEATHVPIDQNRARMLERVRKTWIAGILEHSLHGALPIELGLEQRPDVLANPWRMLVQESDQPATLLPAGTSIVQVYDDSQGSFLILGEPGAGKTTLLLELARTLLNRAYQQEDDPMPVVFHLSTWAQQRLPLTEWLVAELHDRYEVPRPLSATWVNNDRLLLLLDGLDEVAPATRGECMQAINIYRDEHPLVSVVVCSRSSDYLNQPARLRLQTAVIVQPLSDEQIEHYLTDRGEQITGLRERLNHESELRELATTPLMLTILVLAYQGQSPATITSGQISGQARQQIFASYVQRMLKRRGAHSKYEAKQTIHWLETLAAEMKRRNQTIFHIERIQPDWLPQGRGYRIAYSSLLVALLGLVFLLLGEVISWMTFSFLSQSARQQ